MTLEQAKHRYFQQAIYRFRNDGYVGAIVDENGFTEIGNGFKIDSKETNDLMLHALDIALQENINVKFN